MGRFTPSTLALAGVFAFAAPAAHAACDAQAARAELAPLLAQAWKLADDGARQALVLRHLDCLSDPDPALRDGLVFDSLAAWLRAGALDTATVQTIRQRLLARLQETDAQGFAHPFAALALSEVARADRVKAFLSPAERQSLVESAAAYVRGVRDYRGYDEREGWRHGVAHGADWLMQLALNPVLERAQLDAIIEAASSQAAPPGEHAWRYGEGERLARPLLFAAHRKLHTAADWDAWARRLTARLADEPPTTQAGLALRHNLTATLLPLYFMLQESHDGALRERMLPAVSRALRAIG